MFRSTATPQQMVLQVQRLRLVNKEGNTMSNCKTCSQEISWDQKKREALKIRGPLNPDMTVHFCYKEQEAKKIIIPDMVKVDEKPPARPPMREI